MDLTKKIGFQYLSINPFQLPILVWLGVNLVVLDQYLGFSFQIPHYFP